MNQQIFHWLFQFAGRSPVLDASIAFAAQYLPYILVIGFLVLCFGGDNGKKKKLLFLGEAVLALILSRGLLTEIIRFFYNHPRPFDLLGLNSLIPESGNSFPSGHAAFFFALAAVIFMHNRKWGITYFVFGLIIGVARVMAGVHWPLDIIGGAAVGIISGLFVHRLSAPNLQAAELPIVKEKSEERNNF